MKYLSKTVILLIIALLIGGCNKNTVEITEEYLKGKWDASVIKVEAQEGVKITLKLNAVTEFDGKGQSTEEGKISMTMTDGQMNYKFNFDYKSKDKYTIKAYTLKSQSIEFDIKASNEQTTANMDLLGINFIEEMKKSIEEESNSKIISSSQDAFEVMEEDIVCKYKKTK